MLKRLLVSAVLGGLSLANIGMAREIGDVNCTVDVFDRTTSTQWPTQTFTCSLGDAHSYCQPNITGISDLRFYVGMPSNVNGCLVGYGINILPIGAGPKSSSKGNGPLVSLSLDELPSHPNLHIYFACNAKLSRQGQVGETPCVPINN